MALGSNSLTTTGGAKLHIAEKNGITASYKAGIEVENADIDITCYIYGLGNANLTLKGSNSSYTITDYTSSLTYAKVEDSTVNFSPGSGSYSVLERGKTAASAKKQLNPGTFSDTVTTDKYIKFAVSDKKYSLGVTGGTGEIKDPYNPNSSFTFGAGNATVTAEFVQGSTLGDFLVVSDNAGGFSFNEANNVLTISGSGTYSVSMAAGKTSTGHRIEITGGSTVILNGVNINNSSKAPISVPWK